MWSTGSLLVVVGFVLAVQAMEEDSFPTVLLEDGTLITHPQASKELTRDQLLEKLNRIDYSLVGEITESVADLLYRTDDKENTKVFNDVTVAELIDQNELHSLESGCTLESFRRRADLYKRTKPSKDNEGGFKLRNSEFAVIVYVMRLLQIRTYFCMERQKEILVKGILTKSQINRLGRGVNGDSHYYVIDEEMVADAVAAGKSSYLVQEIDIATKREEEAKKREAASE